MSGTLCSRYSSDLQLRTPRNGWNRLFPDSCSPCKTYPTIQRTNPLSSYVNRGWYHAAVDGNIGWYYSMVLLDGIVHCRWQTFPYWQKTMIFSLNFTPCCSRVAYSIAVQRRIQCWEVTISNILLQIRVFVLNTGLTFLGLNFTDCFYLISS